VPHRVEITYIKWEEGRNKIQQTRKRKYDSKQLYMLKEFCLFRLHLVGGQTLKKLRQEREKRRSGDKGKAPKANLPGISRLCSQMPG